MSENKPLKLVFAGTPEFAAQHLSYLLQKPDDIWETVAVFTQPDRPAGRGKKLSASPVKLLALEHNLPVFQPESLKDTQSLQSLKGLEADIMVVVAYGLILPETVLSLPTYGCINVHASLLPRWRGAAPIQRAIEAGDKETGITIMQMDKGLDTGDMLMSVTCPIHKQDTATTLHDRLSELGGPLLWSSLMDIANGKAQTVVQDNSKATYAQKLEKAEAKIDWCLNAKIIEQKVRAFNPFPVAYFQLENKNIRVWEATSTAQTHDAKPGTILNSDRASGIEVACGEGTLILKALQLPGKKNLPVSDVLNAHKQLFNPLIVLQ